MSRVFIIPDIHLKPWIFEQAEKYYEEGRYDRAVVLGDIADDWGQGLNLDLYNETFDAAILFAKNHPEALWCYGNHDVSYVWQRLESGYSDYARDTVVKRINDLRNVVGDEKLAFVHRIDQVVFSHGGLTESFIERHFIDRSIAIDEIIRQINNMGPDELWDEDSPIWARPQYGEMDLFKIEQFQVVGHTPVLEPLIEEKLLTLDTFSTYSDGIPIGNETYMGIDTITFDMEEIC